MNLELRTSIINTVGTSITGARNSQEAMQIAGLDYTVALRPYFLNQIGSFGFRKTSNLKQAVIRTDTKEELGGVGMKYKPIQPAQCFKILDNAIGEENIVYNQAGEAKGGFWIDMKLGTDFTVGPDENNDKIEKHIILINTYDGSSSLGVYLIASRLFCMNQLTGQSQMFKVRHTQNADKRIKAGTAMIRKATGYYQWFERRCNDLFNAPMKDEEMVEFTEELLPPTIKDGEPVVSTRKQNQRNEIIRLFHEGMGQYVCQNTRWAAYNAVSEYTDHIRSVPVRKGRQEATVRFESILTGSGADMKTKAFKRL